MSSQTLNHVSFDLLVKAHNGNRGKAKQAWDAICQLGGFGSVPTEYAGGLDTKGINIARDEVNQGERAFLRVLPQLDAPVPQFIYIEPPSSDDLKRIEDYAAGDTPKK